MYIRKIISVIIVVLWVIDEASAGDDDYNILQSDGSYEFGYNNPDSYHYAQANRNNVVKGEFGARSPKTGGIDNTVYTAGPRGFRPRGKNIVRKYDLNQAGPRPIGSRDDPYYDPYEDPSYGFSFRTRTYSRDENANRVGDVNGRYSYVDDVGERHNVEFIAGKNTGFHVKTPFPDSNPRSYGPLYFRGRGRPIPRGRTSIHRGLDGSYKFVSAGPDQRRTETSDSTGHVRGSYTYLDDKGVQHSVHYIAGPETGYRVLKTVKGPHLPTVFPFNHPDVLPPDFYDLNDKDVFDTAATGHARPGSKPGLKDKDNGKNLDNNDYNDLPKPGGFPSNFGDNARKSDENRPTFDDLNTNIDGGKPNYDNDFNFAIKNPAPSYVGDGIKSKPSGESPGFNFGKRPSAGKPPISPYDEDESDDDTDFGDLFGNSGEEKGMTGGQAGKNIGGSSTTTRKPGKPSNELFGNEGSGKDSFASEEKSKNKPNNGYIPPTNNKGEKASGEDYGNKGDNLWRPNNASGSKPSTAKPSKGGLRPQSTFSTEENDFGLFGSESNRLRPPYNDGRDTTGPIISIGNPTENCPRCKGTILTNVGDSYLSVPPGVSVRTHVQAIDLSPYSSRFPGPSEQYKVDLTLNTEQLNSEKDEIVSKIDETTEAGDFNDDFTTLETTTVFEVTTMLPSNVTAT